MTIASTDSRHLVVVGASLAGLRAAEAARRYGYAGRITLVGGEPHLPYDRPPLSKAVLESQDPIVLTPFRTDAYLRDLNVDLMLGAPATRLNPEAREVQVGAESVSYDSLIIATGARPRQLPGTEGVRGVVGLRTIDDAIQIKSALDAGSRIVVVGAGFIGSEVASCARKRGLPVVLLESLDLPLTRSVGPGVGQVCADLHRANGVDLRTGTTIERVEESGGQVSGVVLDDGTSIAADLVVVGIGVEPETGWLAGSGIALHERDRGVLCGADLRTSVPGIYAAGDVAHWPNALFDNQLMRLEHWTNAAEHGAVAGANAAGRDPALTVESVPYFWSDWHGHRIQFVGSAQDAEAFTYRQEPFLAMYRRGDRLVGALTIDRPTQIMKIRRLVAAKTTWDDAVQAGQTFAGAL